MTADTPAPIAAAKHAARVRAREARDCLDLEACREHAHAIAEQLLSLPELASASIVLTYAALPAEIDPALAIEALRARGARIGYTRIEAPGVLGIHRVDDVNELVMGPLAIRQPPIDAPRIDHAEIDAVIVPGVAFDVSGARLGYGGGYYDQLLPLLPAACPRIGIAFDEQVVAEIPCEEHDAHVDVLVTPTRVIRPHGPNPR